MLIGGYILAYPLTILETKKQLLSGQLRGRQQQKKDITQNMSTKKRSTKQVENNKSEKTKQLLKQLIHITFI